MKYIKLFEQFVNESISTSEYGPKVKKLAKVADELESLEDHIDEYGKVPKIYHDKVKSLGISSSDALTTFQHSYNYDQWETIKKTAAKLGIKYELFEDPESETEAIVLSYNQ